MPAFSVALWDGSMKMKPYGAAGLEVDCTANLGRPGVDALQHDSKAGGAWRKRRNVPGEAGKELHACCGPAAQWLPVPQPGHNEPFHDPRLKYWGGFWTCAP